MTANREIWYIQQGKNKVWVTMLLSFICLLRIWTGINQSTNWKSASLMNTRWTNLTGYPRKLGSIYLALHDYRWVAGGIMTEYRWAEKPIFSLSTLFLFYSSLIRGQCHEVRSQQALVSVDRNNNDSTWCVFTFSGLGRFAQDCPAKTSLSEVTAMCHVCRKGWHFISRYKDSGRSC